MNTNNQPRGPRNTGKEGAEHDGYDKRDGTGRGRRGGRRGGKFSEGETDDRQYQKKGQEASAATEDVAEETKQVDEDKLAEDEVEVVYGVSFEDYFGSNPLLGAKKGRDAQGVSKDTKVEANTKAKEFEQVTKLKNTTAYDVKGKGAYQAEAGLTVGFAAMEAGGDAGAGRGGRGGRGRGGRADNNDRVVSQRNTRQKLRKTEEDFPSL